MPTELLLKSSAKVHGFHAPFYMGHMSGNLVKIEFQMHFLHWQAGKYLINHNASAKIPASDQQILSSFYSLQEQVPQNLVLIYS